MKQLREITNVIDLDNMVLVDSSLLSEHIELTEATEAKAQQNKHLDHAEDMVLRHGPEGFQHVLDTLEQTHDFVKDGKRRKGFRITTKYDGSPSVVWGNDPKNGKFFVGTKSVFNKTPKVNYSPKDVDANHGTSPTLANKLKLLLKELPKTMPSEKGVYQGDLMYTSDDVATDGKHLSFAPNTITYKTPHDSLHGRRILKSKVGVVPHTRYEMGDDGQMHGKFDVDVNKFKKTDDVNMIDPTVRGDLKFKYSTSEQKSVIHNIKRALGIHRDLTTNDGYEKVTQHNPLLLAYMNNIVKNKVEASVPGYIAFLSGQMKKQTEKVKQDSTKSKLKGELDAEVKNIMANKDTFEKVFKLHQHIAKAKNTLVNVLGQYSPFEEHILGQKSKPEGFVASVNDKPVKLVDRQHFSAANFEWNEKVNPEDNPVVLTWGRMNPPTKGHAKTIAKGADVARRIGAKQMTVATGSQDPSKNPLPPATKLKWMKTMFPGQNVSVAADQHHTLIAQLQQLYLNGTKDLTIMAGDDRIEKYKGVLAKYNGPEANKLFNFKRARVISSGARDPGASGTEGVSSTKMRDAAKKSDYPSFRKGVPDHVNDDNTKEMFHTLRAEMGLVKIGSGTEGHALTIYAKRSDKIGLEANKEIDKRKKNGTWKGK